MCYTIVWFVVTECIASIIIGFRKDRKKLELSLQLNQGQRTIYIYTHVLPTDQFTAKAAEDAKQETESKTDYEDTRDGEDALEVEVGKSDSEGNQLRAFCADIFRRICRLYFIKMSA